MGSDQSRSSTGQSAEARPPDYYELLEIAEDATEDEIRVRYVISPQIAIDLTRCAEIIP